MAAEPANVAFVMQMRTCGTPTMFGDIADRRVIFIVEVSARASPALPTVKSDLIETLLRLGYRGDAHTYFNLIEFGGQDVVQWSDRMVLATPQTATVAAQWIRGLTSVVDTAATGVLSALLAAMLDPSCQAVHLATMVGSLTGGGGGAAAALLDSLRRRLGGDGRLRPVHCIACTTATIPASTESATLNFLCDLAAGTGGSVASVCMNADGGVESMTRILTADRPSARRSFRSHSGQLALVAWPLVTPDSAGPVTTVSSALVPSVAQSVPTAGATLIGRGVLARRSSDGLFHRGQVTCQLGPQTFLVEILDAASSHPEHQETPVEDLISLDDALGKPVGPGDFVLVPSEMAPAGGGGGSYLAARVVKGREQRASARSWEAGGGAAQQLMVEMAGHAQAPVTRTVEAGQAVWISREIYLRLEDAAKAIKQPPAGGSTLSPEQELKAVAEPQQEALSVTGNPSEPLAPEKAAEVKETLTPKVRTPPPLSESESDDDEDDFEYFGELGDGGDEIVSELMSPQPKPPAAAAAVLRRRPRRRPRLAKESAEASRVEAYRRAMEAARLEQIHHRRAELHAEEVLRNERLRRIEELAIERQLRAEEAALRGRGALHTAAVIEGRMARQARREADELRRAETDVEQARQRWQRSGGDGKLPMSPEMLRLRRLRLMFEDGKGRLADSELQAQCAKPERTIAEWLIYLRLAGDGSPQRLSPPQPLQQPPHSGAHPSTTQERQRLTRRAQTTGPY